MIFGVVYVRVPPTYGPAPSPVLCVVFLFAVHLSLQTQFHRALHVPVLMARFERYHKIEFMENEKRERRNGHHGLFWNNISAEDYAVNKYADIYFHREYVRKWMDWWFIEGPLDALKIPTVRCTF